MEIEVEPLNAWISEYSKTEDWENARKTLNLNIKRRGLNFIVAFYEGQFEHNEFGRLWMDYEAVPDAAARKIKERYESTPNNYRYVRDDFCMLCKCLQEIEKVKNKHTVPRTVLTEEEVKAKLQIYFTAKFKGIGRDAMFNYFDALVTRLMLPRKIAKEQATIALMIFNDRNSIMTADAPQNFSEWYERLCDVLGWEFHANYKPNKLKVTDTLKKEFYFL